MSTEWLLWMDIITTGDDVLFDKILKINCKLTNFELTIDIDMEPLYVHCDIQDLYNVVRKSDVFDYKLSNMCLSSELTIHMAEKNIVMWLHQNIIKFTQSKIEIYLAGDTTDKNRQFIKNYMPYLGKNLSEQHYVDIMPLRIMCKNFSNQIYEMRPMNNIIEEYRFYKTYFINRSD